MLDLRPGGGGVGGVGMYFLEEDKVSIRDSVLLLPESMVEGLLYEDTLQNCQKLELT